MITQVLPHRHPALRVDRVLEQGIGHARVLKLVSAGEQGLGEAWLLELLAQGSAFIASEALDADIRVAAFQDVEFLDFPGPGDVLVAELQAETAFGSLSRIRGVVFREGEPICRAALVLTRTSA